MLQVGDIVRVREDLSVDDTYDKTCRFDALMEQYMGRTAEIVRSFINFNGRRRYKIDIDGGRWSWTESMLEEDSGDLIESEFSVDVLITQCENGE